MTVSGSPAVVDPPAKVAHRVRTVVLVLLCCYLAAGAFVGLVGQPQQMWQCADPTSSTGIMNYSSPRPGCEPTVSLGERAVVFGTLVVLWLPLGVAQGLANL